MTAPVYTPSDLVGVAWLSSSPWITADGVANQLPVSNEASWATNGFIVVGPIVGGTPHSVMPVHRPVVQVECWATNPGSDRLPWGKANNLANQVWRTVLDRTTFGRPLTINPGGVTYPVATVKGAKLLTEPRRVYNDAGDFAGYQCDLELHWVQAGMVIP